MKVAVCLGLLVCAAPGVVLAQAAPVIDPFGLSGWSAFGLSGLILAWLFLRHIPAKDAQIDKMVESKDKLVVALVDKHEAAVKTVVRDCEERTKVEREAAAAHHAEQVNWLKQIHQSTRENIHALRNFQATLLAGNTLAAAFQSAEVPAWTRSLDGTITAWNPAAERALGWTQGEIVGKSSFVVLVPADAISKEQDVLKRIADGQLVSEYEIAYTAKDGDAVRFAVVSSPIRDQTGRVVAASTIAREV